MALILPGTTIYAINCNLTPTGEDTILFNNLEEQRAYFYNAKVTIFTDYTYQREHRNYIRVSDPDGLMDKCNYLMFINENYENKRYYAFILEINWINNEVCEILYEIDYVQTFLFELYSNNTNHLPLCWVERQHSETDEIGDNIQPERVGLGEYVYDDYREVLNLHQGSVVLGKSDEAGNVYDNIFGGIELHLFNVQDEITDLRTYLINHRTAEDIQFAYMVPTFMRQFYALSDTENKVMSKSTTPRYITPTITLDTSHGLDGYIPKNKKLFTFPYSFLSLSDGNGNSMKLRYEFFYHNLGQFEGVCPILVEVTITPPAAIRITPYNYKNAESTGLRTESLTITNFPMVSWAYDAFKQWVSRSLTSGLIKIAGSAIGSAIGYSIGEPGITSYTNPYVSSSSREYAKALDKQDRYNTHIMQNAAMSAGNTIGNLVSQGYQASIQGDISSGTFSNNGSDFGLGSTGIYASQACINKQSAETIDNYFTMYGYAQNKLMQPNPKARPHYTYIRTANLTVRGSMPAEAKEAIAARFMRGIRFWRNAHEEENLDYTVNNAPI